MSATTTKTNTNTNTKLTLMSKIRRALREFKAGQDAIFRYDREFRA